MPPGPVMVLPPARWSAPSYPATGSSVPSTVTPSSVPVPSLLSGRPVLSSSTVPLLQLPAVSQSVLTALVKLSVTGGVCTVIAMPPGMPERAPMLKRWLVSSPIMAMAYGTLPPASSTVRVPGVQITWVALATPPRPSTSPAPKPSMVPRAPAAVLRAAVLVASRKSMVWLASTPPQSSTRARPATVIRPVASPVTWLAVYSSAPLAAPSVPSLTKAPPVSDSVLPDWSAMTLPRLAKVTPLWWY